MSGIDNLIGWFNTWIADATRGFSHEGRIQQKVDAIDRVGNLDTLENVWAVMDETYKKEPVVIAAYNTAKAKNLPEAPPLVDAIGKYFDVTIESLKKTYMNIEPVPVSGAFGAAVGIVAADFAKDMAVQGIGIIAEAASAGQMDTVTDAFKVVRAKTGYGGIITMLMKAPLEMALMRPLSYQLHDTFKNEIPPVNILLGAAVKGDLDTSDVISGFNSSLFGKENNVASGIEIYRRLNHYAGVDDWAIDAILKGMYREPSLYEIMYLMEAKFGDDEWTLEKLRRTGYDLADRTMLLPILKNKYLKIYRDKVATQYKNLFKEGYITAQTFRLKLAGLDYPTAMIDLLVSEAEALFIYDRNVDLRTTWRTAYKNDLINENDYRAYLGTIMADPARIEDEIGRAAATRKVPKPAVPKIITQGIRVSSKPSWSTIYLDDVNTKKMTPETVETAVGSFVVKLTATDYINFITTVNVPEGKFPEMFAEMTLTPEAKARLHPEKPVVVKPIPQGILLSSRPGYAQIFLDGSDTGILTPETLLMLPGTHQVEVRLKDYVTASMSVSVDANRFIEVHIPLLMTAEAYAILHPEKPEIIPVIKQGIRISSKPSNASIYLDDRMTEKLTPEMLSASIGRHTIKVTAEGFEDASYEVDVAEGKFIEIYAVLEKIE